MQEVRLIPLDAALIDAIIRGAPDIETEYGIRIANVMEWSVDVARQTAPLYTRLPRSWPWGSYLAVTSTSREGASASVSTGRQVVGVCAFKDSPNAAGEVEIAYFTYPPYERRGIATAMARELIVIARSQLNAPQVIAHTLPERNASTRVLERNGLRFTGEVMDPEDGRVWRWELDRAMS